MFNNIFNVIKKKVKNHKIKVNLIKYGREKIYKYKFRSWIIKVI